jgi:hypothetical protein
MQKLRLLECPIFKLSDLLIQFYQQCLLISTVNSGYETFVLAILRIAYY